MFGKSLESRWEVGRTSLEWERTPANSGRPRPEPCENSNSVCESLKACMRSAPELLQRRFQFCSRVSWFLCNSHYAEGAAGGCLQQTREVDINDHDPVTVVFFWGKMGRGLETCAGGAPCSDNLRAFADRLTHILLDESCGEGYHRSINHERQRAPASSMPHLKRQTRIKQTCSMVYGLVRKTWLKGKTRYQL